MGRVRARGQFFFFFFLCTELRFAALIPYQGALRAVFLESSFAFQKSPCFLQESFPPWPMVPCVSPFQTTARALFGELQEHVYELPGVYKASFMFTQISVEPVFRRSLLPETHIPAMPYSRAFVKPCFRQTYFRSTLHPYGRFQIQPSLCGPVFP